MRNKIGVPLRETIKYKTAPFHIILIGFMLGFFVHAAFKYHALFFIFAALCFLYINEIARGLIRLRKMN
jgi:hypothetical protein